MIVKVIVSISENYKDVSQIYFSLMKRNWGDCKWDIIEISDSSNLYYGNYLYLKNTGETLPECIYNIKKIYPADFYIFFLGDAFITCKVSNRKVENLLKEMLQKKINYCNLYKNERCKKNNLYNYLKKNEAYGVEFISFIAAADFIEDEFKDGISDFDFEQKYLLIAKNSENVKYRDFIVADKSVFGVLHGVNKGLWIRKAHKYIQYHYPDIDMGNRRMQSAKTELYEDISLLLSRLISTRTRSKIRKILTIFGGKFYTHY